MYLKIRNNKKGFALIELFVVIGVIVVLVAVVSIPIRSRLAYARDAERASHLGAIQKAVYSYKIENRIFPVDIPEELTDICNTGGTENCVDLSFLLPEYFNSLPVDPNNSTDAFIGYQISYDGKEIALNAPHKEKSGDISINVNGDYGENGENGENEQYTVTFNSNGGNPVPSQIVEHGEPVTEPSNPIKSGHNFIAWYANPEFSTLWDFTSPITSGIIIYARWEIDETVKLDTPNITGLSEQVIFIENVMPDIDSFDLYRSFYEEGWYEFYGNIQGIPIDYPGVYFSYDSVLERYSIDIGEDNYYCKVVAKKSGYLDSELSNASLRTWHNVCLAEGTQISLANGKTKSIEDITYDDDLLVWNFDEGKFDSAKPSWIKIKETLDRYNLIKFEDGKELKIVKDHRIFNKEKGMFVFPAKDPDSIGSKTFTAEGRFTKLVSIELIKEKINYYNVLTKNHFNSIANGILVSSRINNLYPIKDMKFVKDNRRIRPIEDFNVPVEIYESLRLSELEESASVGKLYKKDLDEFFRLMKPKNA